MEKGNLSAGRRGARTAGRSCLLPETGFWHSKTDGSPKDRVWHPRTDSSLVSFDFISTQSGRGRANASPDHSLLRCYPLPSLAPSLAPPLGTCCAGVALPPAGVTSVVPRRLSPVGQHCTAVETPARVHGSTYSPLEQTRTRTPVCSHPSAPFSNPALVSVNFFPVIQDICAFPAPLASLPVELSLQPRVTLG